MADAERLDRTRTALIAYDVCRRALTPDDPARRAAMRPVLSRCWMTSMCCCLIARGITGLMGCAIFWKTIACRCYS